MGWCLEHIVGGRVSVESMSGSEKRVFTKGRSHGCGCLAQAQYLFRTIAARTRRLERYKRLAETPVEELQRQVQEGEGQREVHKNTHT